MKYSVALLITIGLITSCSVQKKHYSKGYHVTFNYKTKASEPVTSNSSDITTDAKKTGDISAHFEEEYQESVAASSNVEDVVSTTKLTEVPFIIKRKVATLINNNRIEKPSKQNESNLIVTKDKKASTKNDSYASQILKLALIFALLLFIFMIILLFVLIFGLI